MKPQRSIFFSLTVCTVFIVNCAYGSRKVNNLQHFVSTEKIEAENFSWAQNALVYACDDQSAYYVGHIYNDTVLGFDNVDFGRGVDRWAFSMSNKIGTSEEFDVRLHLGNYSNPAFFRSTFGVTTRDPCDFVTFTNLDLPKPVSGIQDLYFTFGWATNNTNFIDSFYFNKTEANFVATETIQAENYTLISGAGVYNDCLDTSLVYVGEIVTGTVIGFERVDFGSGGVDMVTLRVANPVEYSVSDIIVHVGSANSTPVATIPVAYTGQCDYYTLDTFLNFALFGILDLYFTADSSPNGGSLDLDWFVFNKTVNAN